MIGNRVKLARERLKITQEELGRQIGISQQAIQKIEDGRTSMPRNLAKIANALGVKQEWLLTGNDLYSDYIAGEVPRPALPIQSNAVMLGGLDIWDNDTPLGDDEIALPFFREVKLAAGNGLSSEVQENHGAKLRFAKSTLKRKGVSADHAACVMVAGNSMEPVLPDGSTVGIDTSKTDIINGKMYAIDHNGELRVKLIYTLPGGGLRLRSYNMDEYPDEPYTDSSCLRILGQVFWYSVLL